MPAFLCAYGESVTVNGAATCVLSSSKQSAGSGVGSAGVMIGCALAMYINGRLGRKRSFYIIALISIIGCIVEMTSAVGSHRYGQFIAGKIINSIAMGLACNVVPIYLSETSITSARGFVINMYQVIQIVGVIVASGAVYAVSTRTDASAYLIPMGMQLVAPSLMLVCGPFLPESPRWLMWQGCVEPRLRSLTPGATKKPSLPLPPCSKPRPMALTRKTTARNSPSPLKRRNSSQRQTPGRIYSVSPTCGAC
jgi:SP family sugar:H+ symporter-like MFS transporter